MNVKGSEFSKISSELEFYKNKIIVQQAINEGSHIDKESLTSQIDIFIQLVRLTKLQLSMLCGNSLQKDLGNELPYKK